MASSTHEHEPQTSLKQSILTLLTGIALGYAALPMVLQVNNNGMTKTSNAEAIRRRLLESQLRGRVDSADPVHVNESGDPSKAPPNDSTDPVHVNESGDHTKAPPNDSTDPIHVNENENQTKEPPNKKAGTVSTGNLKVSTMEDATFILSSDLITQQSIPTSTTPDVMKTKKLADHLRKRVLVTGGAGFVGSHLVDKLMMEGHEVIVMDNFFTGQRKNVEHWKYHPNFSLIVHDVTEPIHLEIDQIYHLACPASPPHYQYNPIKTIKTSTMGTLNMLGLAKRVHGRILLASTSEIYGDPKVHPQHESYWGNVNTIGPRACYDEGKRVAETMMYSYKEQGKVDVRVARIFNTFGPRMHPNDGRVVSNFIIQALQNKDITIYGTGEQSRSFQYVDDLVNGLIKLMDGDYDMPVNLGNPDEYTVKRFAEHIKELTNSDSEIKFLPASTDDPQQRKPDISTAKKEIGWEPQVKVDEGLAKAVKYFKRVLEEGGEIIPTGPGAAKPKEFGSAKNQE